VSVDFGNGHMYVAGATTVDSFVLHDNNVAWRDGTTWLEVAGGGPPPDGSTAQVAVLGRRQLLVTLKAPAPGTVDVVPLDDGAVTGAAPMAVPAPDGSQTPFGFDVYRDGTAVITLANSNQNALFRDGAFVSAATAGQQAPCWAVTVGKYVFVTNTGSRSITRLVGTGRNVFVDAAVAARTPGGGPTDSDADDGIVGVMDHGGGDSHLSFFSYNEFGELAPHGGPIATGLPNANGVAIVAADRRGRR
jgi:hypothetical protein